jgi:hypothetical protein
VAHAAVFAARARTRVVAGVILALLATGLPARRAGADWLAADPSFRDAQMEARSAARDTLGHGAEPGRLDTLAAALLRIGRIEEARGLFARVIELSPADETARAALGKLALFEDRCADAESLLTGLPATNAGAEHDLYAARLRRGEWAQAATLAETAGQPGRAALLTAMATDGAYATGALPEMEELPFARAWPVPLVRVKLNGERVLMAVSTGVADLIVDQSAARRTGVKPLAAEAPIYWSGSQTAARMALVQRLELGGIRLEKVPAGIVSLKKYSLEANPEGEVIAGIIGVNLLRRFTPTLDYRKQRLELRRPGAAFPAGAEAHRVPMEIWGESAITIYGSINGGRKMALIVDSGVPECAVGAPQVVFDELGIKPGMMSRVAKSAGTWLNGSPWLAVSVPTVTVGPIVRSKLTGWSGALGDAELWREGVRRDALLSSDFLHNMRVTFDWEKRALVVEE